MAQSLRSAVNGKVLDVRSDIKLQKILELSCTDKEMLARAAKESGLCEELFET